MRVFIIPRRVEGPAGLTTALRQAMDTYNNGPGEAPGVGVHRLKAATGVNHQTLANLANGVGGVEKGKAELIAAALNRPVSALFVHKDGAELVEA